MKITKECKQFIKERYDLKFQNFNKFLKEYEELKDFAPDGNIWESGQEISDECHFIMRLSTQYYLTEAFKAMKIDLSDANVMEDLSVSNLGTPGRVVKVWTGADVDDTSELGNGRWNKSPRIATFPNSDRNNLTPITKRIDIISNCSHHLIAFDSLSREDSYAIISYIPGEKVLGISKLQKYANYISSRFFLQENLSKKLYEGICEIAETEDVYVKLVNLVHGCESKRSTKSKDGAFTSEMYGGRFNSYELRAQVDRSI